LLPAKKKSPTASPEIVAPVPAPSLAPKPRPNDGRRIFLMDAMSFIFRAYHAMARQRGMSTKTGLPTAATYVFVNMLRKLREDFSPEYLAAVFDVAAPTFRDQEAEAITKVRKFDIKTQTFQEIEYHGYKANRSEMPAELVQRITKSVAKLPAGNAAPPELVDALLPEGAASVTVLRDRAKALATEAATPSFTSRVISMSLYEREIAIYE